MPVFRSMQGGSPHGGRASPGDIMKHAHIVPCESCQEVFRKYVTLGYLYCGHHRIIALRHVNAPVAFMPVKSTPEAMLLIEDYGRAAGGIALTA